VTKELSGLKNKTTKAAKRMKESDQRCMIDDDIRVSATVKDSGAILLLLEVQ
jgi:hypothetical protein